MIAAVFILCATVLSFLIAGMAFRDEENGAAFYLVAAGVGGIAALVQVLGLMGVFK